MGQVLEVFDRNEGWVNATPEREGERHAEGGFAMPAAVEGVRLGPGDVLKQGWMLKAGGGEFSSGLRERHFQLVGTDEAPILSFSKEEGGRVQGAIPLCDVTVINPIEDLSQPLDTRYHLQLSEMGRRQWDLVVASYDELLRWVYALRQVAEGSRPPLQCLILEVAETSESVSA